MSTTSIYALIDPSSYDVRYIGKSSNIKLRIANHLCPSSLKKNTHKNNWLKKLKIKPIVKILCVCKIQNANKLEKAFITKYKNLGAKLTNGTIGGDGWPEGTSMPKTKARKNASKLLRKPVYVIQIKSKRKRYFKQIKDCAKFLKTDTRTVSFHLTKRKVKSIKGYQVFYVNQKNIDIQYKLYKPIIGIHLYSNKLLYFNIGLPLISKISKIYTFLVFSFDLILT